MVLDLAAGAKQRPVWTAPRPAETRPPRILVFDSGLGGLTVFPAVKTAIPDATYVYAADDAVFPYGRLAEGDLVDRVVAVMQALVAAQDPDIVVIACHTASTLVLPPLRERWPAIAFIGTVPAIKPAAAASASKMISVLATPGTVAREYTRALIDNFAADCVVNLVGASGLASLAEAVMRGEAVPNSAIEPFVAPVFQTEGDRRTDVVVLACTHYPLLLSRFEKLAPWPVTWIDPAAAIARRVAQVLPCNASSTADPPLGLASAVFTSNKAPAAALDEFLSRCGLEWQFSPALAALDRRRSL